MNSRRPSIGISLLVVFFAAGALVCVVTVFALLFPGSFLESIWRIKPEARLQFLQFGRSLSIAVMVLVGGACALSAIGLARNTEWGRLMALAVLTINVVGDSMNALFRHDPKTLIGVPIGVFLIFYLLLRKRARI